MKRLILSLVWLLQVSLGAAQINFGPGVLEPIVPKDTYLNPTSMIFLDDADDILVGGFNGKIWRTTDGLTTQIQTLPGSYAGENGFIYLRKHPDFSQNHYVYASFVNQDEGDELQLNRYVWDGASLTSRTKLIGFGETYVQHVGGVFDFGPPGLSASEQKLFYVVGDMRYRSPTANFPGGEFENNAMIVRINQDGSTPIGADRGPFYDIANGNLALERMYAYGFRNSYGMAFDPIGGHLWETDNTDYIYEEINRIEPGMNGGWHILTGPLSHSSETTASMVFFGDSPVGQYRDPVFTIQTNHASVPTAILFYDSNKLGAEYENDCFVAMLGGHRAGIFHFSLNEERTEFIFQDPAFDDKILGGERLLDPFDEVLFAYCPEWINDMRIGPDGLLYVLCMKTGRIQKVVGVNAAVDDWFVY